MIFHRLRKSEQMQHRWRCRLDDLAQRLQRAVQPLTDARQIGSHHIARHPKPIQTPRQACQVCQCLVMQVHPDPLTFAFQRFGQFQRPLTQPFFPRPRGHLDNRRLTGLFGGPQRKEVWR